MVVSPCLWKDTHEAEVLESSAKTLRGKAYRLQKGIHGVIAAWSDG